MWDHSHINNDTHRLPHILPYIFTPYISPKPLFLPKIVTQSHSVTLSKCPEFWKFVTQRPLIGWNLRKRYPNAAYFVMAFVTERPPIFLPCIHMFVWGECCLKHGQKLENVVFSKQNRTIWGILSGANLIKVMKIKFHFYRLNRPNCALYGWISLEGRDDTGYYPPSQIRKGIYPTNTLYKSAPLAQTNAKRIWGCASGGI